jgi:hypothetical protein
MQDSCIVCAECTIWLRYHFGDMVYVESRISLFGDGVSVGVRCTVCVQLTIGSKIILDKLDGTPR